MTPDDAFLTIDLAASGGAGADGVIGQSHEIAFAAWTEAEDTDLSALGALFDVNGDGVFSEADFANGPVRVTLTVTSTDPATGAETTQAITGAYVWTDFRLWRDLDQDGAVDLAGGELRLLDGRRVLDAGRNMERISH